ncbi:unnamed protein product [Rotaria sp. Silwood2]|nr:unnamed protein product [Rotaria sp. Silwood2]
MAKKKNFTVGSNDVSAEEAEREFGISLQELKTLMNIRGRESLRELNETYDGFSGLGYKLKTNLITG